MRILSPLLAASAALSLPAYLHADPPDTAAQAINELGVDLLGNKELGGGNILVSPFSIQSALGMTYAGADGQTKAEMAKVLHFPEDDSKLHASLASLRQALEAAQQESAQAVKQREGAGGKADPLVLQVANRLFGEQDYEFRKPFLGLLEKTYQAPFQKCDFVHKADKERKGINAWVAKTTRDRIKDLIPSNALDKETRLVLVNAIYLKAPWTSPFEKDATKPAPFTLAGGKTVDVPTMVKQTHAGLNRQDGYSAVTLPYAQGQLQFLILLPDKADGLPALEKMITTGRLASAAKAPSQEIILHLPRFKMEPPVLALGKILKDMGLKTAFDVPPGSANFDKMAPRKPNDYLYISDVFHKTFLSLDEQGTEAAAATAVVMMRALGMATKPKSPPEIKVDHPFLFAIQHRASGTCLFLGRMTSPL